ncbi:cysteine hydrolase family protein [Thermotalea metallivorans]|uniref:Peroxyureidoacrylate/ureidoacrylate amidohydrolase RutB n=1 Tax=Thermotalea metallivorans TaxID=520762 RepID=A0A140LDK8_9FIRM|nr:cysteine hydrolase family protein [Thermotalea metallivorans]KXG78633.1 Peroxyureidoacrylate/ureidoacrylate amidohydrolase RutB [Thermotalea metallivorans]
MFKLIPEKTALLIIDVQWDFWKFKLPQVPPPTLLPNLKRLIQFCRSKNMKIVYIKHISHNRKSNFFQEGTEGAEIMEEIRPLPEDHIVIKHTPGAFFNSGLDDYLRKHTIENLVITGMQTDHCCDTTTREAHALGYRNYFITDCTATFDMIGENGERISREEIQRIETAILSNGFATCLTMEALMALF